MRTVWKVSLPIVDEIAVKIPGGAAIVHVATQGPVGVAELSTGEPVSVWFECDPERPPELRRFAIYGTGHMFRHERQQYLGSAQFDGGGLVFHLYEVMP